MWGWQAQRLRRNHEVSVSGKMLPVCLVGMFVSAKVSTSPKSLPLCEMSKSRPPVSVSNMFLDLYTS